MASLESSRPATAVRNSNGSLMTRHPPPSQVCNGPRALADRLPAHLTAELARDFDVRYCTGSDRQELLVAVSQASALLVRSATRVDQEVFDAAPLLQVVARAGVGLDNVDVEAATRAAVTVANAPYSNVVSVAELTVGLIIALARLFLSASASVHEGQWRRADFQGVELAGRTAGILGLGKVGELVAARLRAFGMRVLTHDPHVRADALQRTGAHAVSLKELLRESDVRTVHVPLTDATRNLIGERELSWVKPSLHLVNTARGGIVNKFALAQALKEGRSAGAALDVFEFEPPVSSPLLGLAMVIATPHIGAGTAQAQERAGREAIRAVRQVLTGSTPDRVG
ncbi:hydroxyacid dehydrogenase [Streptomyces lavendofoliae]|uniref:hydroxyacid dehydrogenase n=1 Tax=Streptomyces lavendofoliae TaxID=67314 RepID=UPI003D8A3850